MKNIYDLDGDKVIIFLDYKGIRLPCYIDEVDLPKVASIKGTWGVKWNPTAATYYARYQSSEGCIWMHRWLLNVINPDIIVDHNDHNGLNNKRDNIKPSDVNGNGFNRRGAQTNNGSGKRNVYWHEPEGKWEVSCVLRGIRYSAGYFSDSNIADEAAKRLRADIIRGTTSGVPIKIGNSNKDKTHCSKGHPFSRENTWYRANGRRTCKTCDRAYHKKENV